MKATLVRRTSFRKPISPAGFERHQRNDDRLLLAPLETIDAINFNTRYIGQAFAQRADLRPVWSDDAKLPR